MSHRYELGLYVGPCSEEEASALADAILGLSEAKVVGADAVSITELADDDPLFADRPVLDGSDR